MALGPPRSHYHDAEELFQALGNNRACVESYLAQASRIICLSGGGSDRRFFRLELARRHAVLMVSPPHDKEFENYLAIARFLRSIGVAAPEIYDVYADNHLLVMEDCLLWKEEQPELSEEEDWRKEYELD